MRRRTDQCVRKPQTGGFGTAAARQVDAGGVRRCDRCEIVVHRHARSVATAERDQRRQESAPLSRRQILLAQAEPAAPARKYRFGNLLQRPSRLTPVRNDQAWWNRENQRGDLSQGRTGTRSRSASTVTRITASPGSATGAAIAIAAKRGTGRPPVSALPTRRSRYRRTTRCMWLAIETARWSRPASASAVRSSSAPRTVSGDIS